MRNDHLRLVTDAGAALDLGWRSTAPPPTGWPSSSSPAAWRPTPSPCWTRTATSWSCTPAITSSPPTPPAAERACRRPSPFTRWRWAFCRR
nr:MAG TPA: hypothetical protein [Caudoviricetes sp.]